MLDINLNKKDTDTFHIQFGQPTYKHIHLWELFRFSRWHNIFKSDGSKAWFWSVWFYKLQLYKGTAKCDGTRSNMLWLGQLEDGVAPEYDPDLFKDHYVMNTHPAEMWAVRWRTNGAGELSWNNMGGS